MNTEQMRQEIELSEIRVGSRVTVSPSCQFSGEWPGEYVVVSMTWEYQDMGWINVGIASADDIKHASGWTDGFSLDDLIVVR
ncbi:hypothetical protein [Bradyrhizobium sp. DASA03007]|uniref:hypothetical protein n=1 Tax=unclassified Bradyrhizobium TaxID=2631580 RepID=UPI003F6F4D2B